MHTLRVPGPGRELSSPDSRRSPPVSETDRPTDRPTQGRGSHCPVPLILAPDVVPPSSFPSLPPAEFPNPCNPFLPLGAGGESRSALGTIRGLGGANVAGPGGGRGGVGAGVGGKKVQGNSGTISCWGGEGQRVGVKPRGSPPPPSARHLTGDPGDRRRALDTSAGSRACSGLAVHRQNCEGCWGPHPIISQDPVPPLLTAHTAFGIRAQVPHCLPPCPPAEPAP